MVVVLKLCGEFSFHLPSRRKRQIKTHSSDIAGNVLEHFDSFLEFFFPGNPAKLLQLANLPLDAPLWVQIGKQDELAEAELKCIGPLIRGSSAVLFGVQLKVE